MSPIALGLIISTRRGERSLNAGFGWRIDRGSALPECACRNSAAIFGATGAFILPPLQRELATMAHIPGKAPVNPAANIADAASCCEANAGVPAPANFDDGFHQRRSKQASVQAF